MGQNNLKNVSGFSLVELLTVVAIISILASIAVPNFNKLSVKARSSESKIQLSALYAAEKSFYAEYLAYHNALPAIGYAPEGKVRFNVGFSPGEISINAGVANGFKMTLLPVQAAAVNTLNYCANVDGFTGVNGNACNTLHDYTDAVPPELVGFTVSQNDFQAGAVMNVPISYAENDDEQEHMQASFMPVRPILQILAPQLVRALTCAEGMVCTPNIPFADAPETKYVVVGVNSKKKFVETRCLSERIGVLAQGGHSYLMMQNTYRVEPDTSGADYTITCVTTTGHEEILTIPEGMDR